MVYHRLNLGVTKAYLLRCGGGFLLIDTGYSHLYARFREELKRVGVPLPEIRYLLLTHHHDDHAGFAAELVRETGVTVIAHQGAVTPLARGENEDTMHPLNRRVRCVWGLYRLIHREFTYPPLSFDGRALIVSGDDNRLLYRLGIEGTILHTPGHSSDSISVLLDDGNCFAGDAAMGNLPFCGTKHKPIHLESLDQVYLSWTKLLSRGAKTIHPAHGGTFPAELLRPAVREKGSGHEMI